MGLFSGNTLLAGLDIQPGSVRLVRLSKHYSGFRLSKLAALDLPPALFAEGKIKQWDVLRDTLSEWVRSMDIVGLPVALHVPANLVRMHSVQLPAGLLPIAIEAQIHAHVQREMPRVAEKLCVDYVEVKQRTAYMDVLFAASRQDYLNCYTDCINASGLVVKVVDIDVYAIQRLVCFALDSKAVTACVAIMNGMCALVIFNAHEILFHRRWDKVATVNVAMQLTQQLQAYVAPAKQRVIEQYVYCGPSEDVASVRDVMPNLQVLDPLACMTISSVPSEATVFPAHEYLTACGLAMREVPSW